MDPRAALLQQESEENGRQRNRSIGMHNLRAKLREQLKGYSHVRGFPLDPENTRGEDRGEENRRRDSLSVRRDSVRRRNSSVRQQDKFYDEAGEDSERKYKLRKPRKAKQSLLVQRLLWTAVYASLCFLAYKGITYLFSETQVSLCQPCEEGSGCGVLDEEFTVPIDNLGGLRFGTVLPQQSSTQCRAGVCVPSHVADPAGLCKVVSDEALLFRTRRLLQNEGGEEEHTARFMEYFRRRAMREEGRLLATALSPEGNNDNDKGTPPPTPSGIRGPPPSPPRGDVPLPGPSPSKQGNLANGAYLLDPKVPFVSLESLPASDYTGGGNCSTLTYSPAMVNGNGYANLTSVYYRGITDVENYEQCCSLCANDQQCLGWTRVAGGDPTVRNCYLKSTLDLDPNPSAIKFNYQPKMLVYPTNLEVRYTSNVPIMFESGTRGWTDLPSYLYGCPYPPAADGTCTVPVGCNCGGGVCYAGCTAPPSNSVAMSNAPGTAPGPSTTS